LYCHFVSSALRLIRLVDSIWKSSQKPLNIAICTVFFDVRWARLTACPPPRRQEKAFFQALPASVLNRLCG
jgi:hypothetical protein